MAGRAMSASPPMPPAGSPRSSRTAAAGGADRLRGAVIPGMPNLHSHAFQRAMAGPGRAHGPERQDSFWSWRETMYALRRPLGPDDAEAIAAQLYVEMLEGRLHPASANSITCTTQPDGTPYAEPAAMSLALIAAAREAGIGLTLLPVLYHHRRLRSACRAGAGAAALRSRPGRLSAPGRGLPAARQGSAGVRIGVAPHSCARCRQRRCATRSGLATATAPIHIHVAEQIGEVQDCLAARGARPVEWLLDHAPVDARWCLVHATHMTRRRRARSPPAARSPGCARPPRRISATACFRCRPGWRRAALRASAPTAMSAPRPATSCGCSRPASACCASPRRGGDRGGAASRPAAAG